MDANELTEHADTTEDIHDECGCVRDENGECGCLRDALKNLPGEAPRSS